MAYTQRERNRRYREKPEKRALANAATNEWQKKNKEHRNAYARKWHAERLASQPELYRKTTRGYRLKRRYGISSEDYEAILTKQDGHCALCEKTPDQERAGYLHVDHCHDTGKVRGLLCEQHNLALGKLGDNEASLSRALEYIRGTGI